MNEESKILNELIKSGNQEQPPAELDDIILNQAKKTVAAVKTTSNWRPILAAASVILALPMVWYLTQTPELVTVTPDFTADSQAANKKAVNQADSVDMMVPMTESVPAPSAVAEPATINVLDPAQVSDNLQEMIEEQGRLSITENLADQPAKTEGERSSIEASRKMLVDELKSQKRSIKPSTMGPLMALEYAQFNRYLEERQFDLADQLLTEMQESFPDYDYEEMIYSLALAEANQENN